ncbi:MAG TPA: TonB-dependent receptor, partial [Polyangia bacterium]|nr:TonB-dependent receptor [Polyangia bacterium]
MNRIRRGALVVGLATSAFTLASLGGRPALAQEITGRVTGRVSDQDTGASLAGVTVIVQGPQGEDATITDDKGLYQFTGLVVGTYTIRFYMANSATQVEQPGVVVSAEKTVRVNAKVATQAQAAAQQTYVITGKAPAIDVGSARVGTTFDEDYTLHLALGTTFGDVIAKAPGAFVDASGNVSIGGATGLENIYMVNGLNVTGLRYGNLEAGVPTIGGGSNLPNEFLTQIDVNSGGYQAEFGGAMGGVINTVLKSGSNEFHGSVFGSYSPYWLSASPTDVKTIGSSIGGVKKPDFDDRIGFEVGGPIIPNKLFFWIGMAPQITDDHRFRLVYQQQENGSAAQLLPNDTQRLNETHRSYSYAANFDFIPKPDHKLSVSVMGTPDFNNQLRSFTGFELDSAFPSGGQASWAQESLTKTNTDVSAHWTSKLFDRHWTIEALGGFHDEYLYDRSPSNTLNNLNQLEYYGSNLGTLENL